VQDKKQQQLAALDAQYQAKIMTEVERYQTLLQEKELLNQKWDEQNATLVEAHEKVVHEITEELEAKLLEEQMNFSQQHEEKEELTREFEAVKRQLEEDADRCTFPLLAASFLGIQGIHRVCHPHLGFRHQDLFLPGL
jgi:cilia- and flagella-associated protein 57